MICRCPEWAIRRQSCVGFHNGQFNSKAACPAQWIRMGCSAWPDISQAAPPDLGETSYVAHRIPAEKR